MTNQPSQPRDDMNDRYAVVGRPVAHSLSPTIHAAFAKATGQSLRYCALEAEAFAPAAAEFFAAGGSGLNVTVPFKGDAWRWVDEHDEAAGCGAVNTIVLHAGRTRGCNTDGVGLVQDLSANLCWPLSGARVLILGAGGAVQGIVPALQAAGVADMMIANRTRAKAIRLGRRFGVAAGGLNETGSGWDIVLNGTAASLGGDAALVAPAVVADARCYDLFYAVDGATPFCRWAAAHGAAAARDGLGMLVEQAAEAFCLWRNVRPDTANVLAALRQHA